MIVYITRHAWAEEPGDPAWSDDAQRPLTREGQERFAKIVKILAERGLDPAIQEPDALRPLLRPYPAGVMLALPVSPHVNNPRNDDPKCIAPAA